FASAVSHSKKFKSNLSPLVSSHSGLALESEDYKEHECHFPSAIQTASIENPSILFRRLYRTIIVHLFKALAKELPPTSLPSTETESGENSQRLANIWNVLRTPWGRLCRMIISDLDEDEDGNENDEYLIGDSSKSLEEPTDQLINEDADINLAEFINLN
ncbi:hypothetical protein VP01_10256g1, partial [Puccinia sorghi]